MTVIDETRTRARVDEAIPLEPDSHPAIGFEDDLILVLEQVLPGGGAAAIVRRIEVEADDCGSGCH